VRSHPRGDRPAAKARPKAPARFVLPPIVLPRVLAEPLRRQPPLELAALALGLAALTAASGAGLVASWSRR